MKAVRKGDKHMKLLALYSLLIYLNTLQFHIVVTLFDLQQEVKGDITASTNH